MDFVYDDKSSASSVSPRFDDIFCSEYSTILAYCQGKVVRQLGNMVMPERNNFIVKLLLSNFMY